jgi:hypothetical protein
MAKIIYLKETWIVIWHEKEGENLFIRHREEFDTKAGAVAFVKKLDTPKEREKRGLPLTKKLA